MQFTLKIKVLHNWTSICTLPHCYGSRQTLRTYLPARCTTHLCTFSTSKISHYSQ